MQLGELCAIRSGLTLRERLAEVRSGGTLAVQQGDLSRSGTFEHTSAIRIAAPNTSSHRVSTDELVVRSRGPFWSAWAPGDFGEPVVAVAPLFILRPVANITPAYLAWFIGRPNAQHYFAAEAMGTGVKMIPKAVLARLPIEFPPLSAQHDIVAAAGLASRDRALSFQLADLRHERISADLDTFLRHSNTTPPESSRAPQ